MKSQYRTIAVLLAASLSFAVSANAQTVWTNAGTANWFTAGNWSAGVPNSGVDAQVNNGGTARINSGTGAANSVTLGLAAGNSGGLLVQTGPGSTLNVTNDILIGDAGTGTMTLHDDAKVTNVNGILGNAAGSTGTVTMNGTSAWNNSADVQIGGNGTGTLTLAGSATVSDVNGFIGSFLGAVGSATVGASSTWTNTGALEVGANGMGTLDVKGGGTVKDVDGYVGAFAGSTGDATVQGTGSTWQNSGMLQVGSGGTGSLTIKTGGAVSDVDAGIGVETGSSGTVTVNGNSGGATWTNTGDLTIGLAGDGTLNIKNAGTVSDVHGVVADLALSTGKVTVDGISSQWNSSSDLTVGGSGDGILKITAGGVVSNSVGVVGSNTGSTGKVTVDGMGSQWNNTNNLFVGGNGDGKLDITAAGVVTNVNGLVATGLTGEVTVDGAGSKWTNSGYLIVGNTGVGSLDITNGGLVSNTSGTIAATAGANGSNVTVDASTWTNTAALIVGELGNATLTIKKAGMVSDTTGTIANSMGSVSEVDVSGKNSTWTNSSTLTVGNGGDGTLMVTAGTVSNTDGIIANQSTSTSSVTFDGPNAIWTNSGNLEVGASGNAALSILNGATVTVNGAFARVAEQSSSTSSVTVDGAGSTWALAGELDVARDGSGTMTIQNGGTVNMTGAGKRGAIAVSAGSTGTANIDGAGSTWTINARLLVGADGNGTMNITAGGAVSNTTATIADGTGSIGLVTVDGAMSTWTNSGLITVGLGGNGTMNVTNGGVVSNTTANIASQTGSVGSVTIDGAGSQWNINGDLTVGDSGNGTLVVQNNADVTSNNAFIANNAGSVGLVRVDGAGSIWDMNANTLFVGKDGDGTLEVLNGAQVAQNVAIVGDSGTATGTVLVDGTLSDWSTITTLILAKDGATGSMTISNGGHVMDATGEIALDPGSNGTAIVQGTGSVWDNNALYVGGFSGGAGGTGLLRIIDNGTVNAPTMVVWAPGTLEVNSTYNLNAANLVFDGGTLRTLDDTTFGNNADLAPGGVFVDSNGFTSTLTGVFTGGGGLTKIGDGTIIIGSAQNYTGDTNINAGVLQVDASITSNTFVNPNGTLSGTGTIFGNVVNDGNVSPGDSPGTLTITGNYAQTSNGNLMIEIASLATHDLLQVGGPADLDGNLQLLKVGAFTPHVGDKIIFLTAASGVNGEFATVTSDFDTGTLVTSEVVYEPNDVALLFTQGSFFIGGLTPNQQAVAGNLNNSVGDPRAGDLINFLDTELIANLPHDYDLIAPEELAALYEISFSKAIVQNMNLQHRTDDIRAGSTGFSGNGFSMNTSGTPAVDSGLTLAYSDGKVVLPVDNKDKNIMVPTHENRWGVFATGSGDFVNVDGNDNAHGYDISSGTVLVGVDYRVGDHFAIGLDGSYSGGRANLVDDGRIDMDGGQLGAYATVYGLKFLFGNIIHFDAGVNGGWNDYDTHRNGLQNMPVRGSTDGSEFNAFIAYGGDWHFGRLLVGTWSTLQYTTVNVNSFTETGSLAPLYFPDQDEDSLRASTGLRLAYDASFGRTIFRPEIRAGWEHEYGDRAYPIDARFASGAGGIFTVHGPSVGRDSAIVDAGFSILWNNRVSTYVFYDGNLGRSNYNNNAVSGGFRVTF